MFGFCVRASAGLAVLSLLASTVGCVQPSGGGGGQVEEQTITEITYAFGDSSVPPEYHRSYTITVTADSVSVVVDSYGDILADEEYDITAEQFAGIVNSLEDNDIRECPDRDDDGCGGGTSETISYADGDTELFSEVVYHCGGEDYGTLCGDTDSFADDVEALVPNLDELLAEGE